MDKNLIQKIQKLLALANSSNQNEAELASKKAQELLLKHNISMASVENAQFDFTEHTEELKRQPVEAKFIQSLLVEFFFIKIIHDKIRDRLVFVGTEENIQVAMYVRDFLRNTFKRLYAIENKAQNWKGKNRNAFYLGLYKGLRQKLESEKQKATENVEAGKALIVVDRALVDFMNSRHDNLKNRSHGRIKATNAEAVERGHEHGRKLNISRGLGESSTAAPKALKGGSQ